MRTTGAVVYHARDLGEHVFAVAVARERVHAPQHLPVDFRNGERHGANSHLAGVGNDVEVDSGLDSESYACCMNVQ